MRKGSFKRAANKITTIARKNSFYFIVMVLIVAIFLPVIGQIFPRFYQCLSAKVKLLKYVPSLDKTAESEYYEIIVALGVVISALQYINSYYLRRKERSVAALREWTDRLRAESTSARKLVDSFSKEQCEHLNKEEEFAIYGEEQINLFNALCSFWPKEYQDDNIDFCNGEQSKRLPKKVVVKLRYSIVEYLNSLECLLISWQMNLVDREIIEVQINYLMKESYASLFLFREVQGGKQSYPAIAEFEEKCEKYMKDHINILEN